MSFLEKTIFSPFNYLGTFGKNQLPTCVQIYFRTLFCWIDLFVHPYFSTTLSWLLGNLILSYTIHKLRGKYYLLGLLKHSVHPAMVWLSLVKADFQCYSYWDPNRQGQFILTCERRPSSLRSSWHSTVYTSASHPLSHSYTDSVLSLTLFTTSLWGGLLRTWLYPLYR